MPKYHICIAGKNQIAVDALLYLISKGWGERLMVCPNKNDTGNSNWQPSLARFAGEFSIPIVTLEEAQKINNLVFISLEFDRIIRPAQFASQRLYNIHFSELPAYKGMYTSALPLLHGCERSGVTLHEIDPGIDTGNIVAQKKFDINNNWNCRELYFAYMSHGFTLFCGNFDKLVANHPVASIPQPSIGSTYFSKNSINYRDIVIDTKDTAFGIVRQLKAFSFREYQVPKIEGMSVGAWSILPSKSSEYPGTILEKSDNNCILSTIDYDLKVLRFTDWDWFNLVDFNTRDCDPSSINILDKMGWSPLIRAVYKGDISLCKLLLRCGADPNVTNLNGTTPLMYSFACNNRSAAEKTSQLLIAHGAKINEQDKFNKALRDYDPAAFHFAESCLNSINNNS
ncbi:formyltransferase family protein [Synechococcus sp. UW179A]|uniref:formyltransferase family protein n=1 Tax=Synechococcus sp. UW179A TaxID=2575510 RepID=UPI001482235D|nr:formyltransferase family protein [Synechococcus sp. UW179A]